MARWEPDARERLTIAALELFTEQGYDETTVPQIAERAGLTKSTFFRHFPDKREVLFFGQDALIALFVEGITDAPASASALEAVAGGFEASAAGFPPERHAFAANRRAVIAANPELQEREARKRTVFVDAMTRALTARGVEDLEATLAAQLGGLAFSRAFARWADPSNREEFAVLAGESLAELRSAAAALA
jgi:AcrR family transcriptional regulator